MLSNRKHALSNLNLHKTRDRILGSSFKQPKGKLKRYHFCPHLLLSGLGTTQLNWKSEGTSISTPSAFNKMSSVLLVSFQVGFFSGRKKESIFKSPDDYRGKVGVTGSGKGLTDFQRREKHLHLKGGSADALEDDE
jgi:hypothetical protein